MNDASRPQILARPSARAATILLALALAGCGTMRRGTPAVTAAPPAQDRSAARAMAEIRDAIAALNRGDPVAARRTLISSLRRQPGDATARRLLGEIDTDPRTLLGAENYSYTLRPGENLSSVAQSALGDPLLFYALARYNNIAVPTSVVPGQVILVPGHRRPPPPPPPAPSPAPARPRPAPPRPTVAAPPRAAPRATNPALAARLRAQGLGAMNAGQINRAVGLLRQALSLDPDNAVIRNDLSRALRIQSTVQGHH